MNYQFFGTAGIITAILLGLFVVFGLLAVVINEDAYCYHGIITVLYIISFSCAGIVVLFWAIVGIICGLNDVWGWGLVQ